MSPYLTICYQIAAETRSQHWMKKRKGKYAPIYIWVGTRIVRGARENFENIPLVLVKKHPKIPPISHFGNFTPPSHQLSSYWLKSRSGRPLPPTHTAVKTKWFALFEKPLALPINVGGGHKTLYARKGDISIWKATFTNVTMPAVGAKRLF